MSRRRLALVAVGALAVLGGSVAVGSSVVSRPSTTPEGAAPSAAPTASATPRPEPSVVFEDPEAGFSIAYPRGWRRLRSADEDVRLLVADGSEVSLLARVTPVGLEVTAETLELVRALTDSLVTADRRVELLARPARITLDGVPGYRYLYAYRARGDGERGAHVHYFLFRRKRMISLVFQVPGVRALERSLGVLDRVVGSFRVS